MALAWYYTKRAQVAAKVETTEGTFEALAAADAKPRALVTPPYDPDLPFEPLAIVAAKPGSFAGIPGAPRLAQIGLQFPLVGSGTAGVAPAESPFWQALGFDESISGGTSATYLQAIHGKAISAEVIYPRSASNGLICKVYGARANGALVLNAGMPPQLNCDLRGVFSVPADGAVLAPTQYTTSPVMVQDSAFVIDSIGHKFKELTINIENELEVIDDPTNDTDGAGAFSVIFGQQIITGTITVVLDNPSTYDWFTKWSAGTESAFSLVLGATAGNILTITAPKFQIATPGMDFGGAKIMATVEFQMNRNVGNDALSLVYT